MSTRIGFKLDRRLDIRCEIVASPYSRRVEWQVKLDGTIVAFCTTEGEAQRVRDELVKLADRIGTGALDEDRTDSATKVGGGT